MKTLLTTLTLALTTALASSAMAAPTAYANKVELCNESAYVINVRVPDSTRRTVTIEQQNCHSFPYPTYGRSEPAYIYAYVSYDFDRYVETEVQLYNGDTMNVSDPANRLAAKGMLLGAKDAKPSSKVNYTIKHAK